MIRRALIGLVAAGALAATAAFLAPALAQTTHVVEARDPAGNPPASGFVWDPGVPDAIAAETGDTVSWEFDQAGVAHNLFLVLPNGDELHLSAPPVCPGDDPTFGGACAPGSETTIDYSFDEGAEEGTYVYVCKIHAFQQEGEWVGMVGEVVIGDGGGDPDPVYTPNPNRPSGPPWEADTGAPRLSKVKLRPIRRGVRARLRLSHTGTVKVRFRRRGRAVHKRTLRLSEGVSRRRIRSRRLRPGRYRVALRYRDRWGFQGRPKVVRKKVRVRR